MMTVISESVTASRALDLAETHYNAHSSRKRRKYVPGGPGGGGRFEEKNPQRVPRTGIRRPDLQNNRNSISPALHTTPRARQTGLQERPVYDSAGTAASAVAQADGYKPREERGWDEFHPDLRLEAQLAIFSAEEVDGARADSKLHDISFPQERESPNMRLAHDLHPVEQDNPAYTPPLRRRPGRPPRGSESSMLNGLGSPPAPKIVPLPAYNPKERLNLPKPSFRKVDPFTSYDGRQAVQVNYVDRSMANVGFQESDLYLRPINQYVRMVQSNEDDVVAGFTLEGDGDGHNELHMVNIARVEYDMDEQDAQWLDAFNQHRRAEDVESIKPAVFEITMTQIEREWHALERRIPKPNPKPPQRHRPRSNSTAAVNGELAEDGEEQDSKCAICDDGDCENTNAIVFCDGCDLAVHQECYGVPFIPEGQWLCRKCQLIGRAIPTCVFCPNTDGAFKLTSESKWAHLICAIWIPEISLGNTTFMEPVMDVVKIPKQRWRLTCYLCQQKMGACIQCGNRNCFQAFHVTCARRAKLYLKMKSTHGGPANLDASGLKAFCDKHVPSEWRREHDVDRATTEAKSYFRHSLRGRRWADSQVSALSIGATPQFESSAVVDVEVSNGDRLNTPGKKRKQGAAATKVVWRLPSGAPIVPHVVFTAVETALQRLSIRKRKEYVAEACKYWTLKREARRGAALLKRLQLQMETFSSNELTRRDFAAMGASGGPRLQRRIDFAVQLQTDMLNILEICSQIKTREEGKLQDVETLKSLIDTAYFPIPALLQPVLRKAQSLDTKGFFHRGLHDIEMKLKHRVYTSVVPFVSDLGNVFVFVLSRPASENGQNPQEQSSGPSGFSPDVREVRKLARRIGKAIQPMLQDVAQKESSLFGKPYAQHDIPHLETILDQIIATVMHDAQGHQGSEQVGTTCADAVVELSADGATNSPCTATANIVSSSASLPKEELQSNHLWTNSTDNGADTLPSPVHSQNTAIEYHGEAYKDTHSRSHSSKEAGAQAEAIDSSGQLRVTQANPLHNGDKISPDDPPTPPLCDHDTSASFDNGGLPWYVEEFDICGTTLHEERWTGRDVVRGMSEELSEIDDKDLQDMREDMAENGAADEAQAQVKAATKSAAAKKRRRAWRYR